MTYLEIHKYLLSIMDSNRIVNEKKIDKSITKDDINELIHQGKVVRVSPTELLIKK